MAQDKERGKVRKTQDADQHSTRFAEAAGEGVSGNEVIGMGRGGVGRQSRARRRPEDDASWSGTASPEERPVHEDMVNNRENFDAASRSASTAGSSSFYARAQQRRSGGEGQRGAHASRQSRDEGMPQPSMEDVARGYGVDRDGFYGSRSLYARGGETDQGFRDRSDAVSPNFGDNLGAGADYGSSGSDLGPGIGANRAYGYGAVPSFGSSSPRGAAESTGYGVGYGTPGGYGERPTFRGRQTSELTRSEPSRSGVSRSGAQHDRSARAQADAGGASHTSGARGDMNVQGDYPEATFEHRRDEQERARASNQPFDRGSLFGTANLPPTDAPHEAMDRPAHETRRSRWRREPLTARDIMTRDVRSVHPDASIRDAAKIMRDQSAGVVPVVGDDDTLQGMVTDRDIVLRSIAEGKDPMQLTAGDLMTRDIDAATPDEALVDVIRLMGDKQVRRVPVVDQHDRLLGIISMADVATRADYDTDLQDALEEISLRRSFWIGG